MVAAFTTVENSSPCACGGGRGDAGSLRDAVDPNLVQTAEGTPAFSTSILPILLRVQILQ